jgi:hypothetical protein
MLFLVQQDQFQKHLHTLANLAKLLHKKDFRDGLESKWIFAAVQNRCQQRGLNV